MSEVAKRPATYADLEAVPPHLVAQILFGSLVTHPRPSTEHGAAATSLSDEPVGPFQKGRGGPGGWIFVGEGELHLGPHVTVPDIAGWRSEPLPPGSGKTNFLEIPPDWICEILSPTTEKHDRGAKQTDYALYGVAYLWHLDPRVRCLETFTRNDKARLLTGTYFDNDEIRVAPFAENAFNSASSGRSIRHPNRNPDPLTSTSTPCPPRF